MTVDHKYLVRVARERLADGFLRSAATVAAEAIQRAYAADDSETLVEICGEFERLIAEFDVMPVAVPEYCQDGFPPQFSAMLREFRQASLVVENVSMDRIAFRLPA